MGLALVIFGISLMFFGIIDVTKGLNAGALNMSFTSFIYAVDSQGNSYEYESLRALENRVWVDLGDIPSNLKYATIAIEDERFYKHTGFDFKSTVKAVFDYVLHRSGGRGASTITQQLIKNITGNDQVKVTRKVQEIVQAVALERKLSKDQILELYMNVIYLGEGCCGVAAASTVYFGKPVDQLDLAECALIAGITQFPSRYDPFLNIEASRDKRNLVLSEMLEQGYINEEQYNQAVNEEIKLNDLSAQANNQSYFADQVINDVLLDLQEQKGFTEEGASKLLYTGGLKIYATIDADVQEAIDVVFQNSKNFPASKKSYDPESAMVVMDPSTGAIKGIVGGRGEKKADRTLNRATQSYRQPGSTMKPIGVYAPAIELGLIKPNSVYVDKAVTYGNWSPKNYYSGFRGSMTIRHAIEQSVNTVAVQVLEKMGLEPSFSFLKNKLGVTSLVAADENLPSLALGGLTNGISPLELTAAYAAFANKGVYIKPYTYTKVEDSNGRTILENRGKTTIAMKESTAKTMNSLLKSVVTNGTGTAANFRKDIDICGKTGTTDEDKDRWFVGYTPYYVATVWFGFDQPESMSSMFSANPTIPIWRKVMAEIHKNKAGKKFDTSGVSLPATDIPAETTSPTNNVTIKPSDALVAPSVTSLPSVSGTPLPGGIEENEAI
jgi:penicillin-binding protein 1A